MVAESKEFYIFAIQIIATKIFCYIFNNESNDSVSVNRNIMMNMRFY